MDVLLIAVEVMDNKVLLQKNFHSIRKKMQKRKKKKSGFEFHVQY